MKHGRLGSKSEGADYYLQTKKGDFVLEYKERDLWEPDYHLEFCSRRIVEVSGKIITDTPTEDGPQPLNPKPYLRYSLYIKFSKNIKSERFIRRHPNL